MRDGGQGSQRLEGSRISDPLYDGGGLHDPRPERDPKGHRFRVRARPFETKADRGLWRQISGSGIQPVQIPVGNYPQLTPTGTYELGRSSREDLGTYFSYEKIFAKVVQDNGSASHTASVRWRGAARGRVPLGESAAPAAQRRRRLALPPHLPVGLAAASLACVSEGWAGQRRPRALRSYPAERSLRGASPACPASREATGRGWGACVRKGPLFVLPAYALFVRGPCRSTDPTLGGGGVKWGGV